MDMYVGVTSPVYYTSMLVYGYYIIIQVCWCTSCINLSIQQVLPPILLAQMGKKWEVVELLTDKYGCSINLPLLSFQVYLFVVVLVTCMFSASFSSPQQAEVVTAQKQAYQVQRKVII